MTKPITNRDWEALSAYLDKEMNPKEQARLESQLSDNPELQEALEALRRTRLVLRSQPRMRAPRNFSLTSDMAGQRASAQRAPRAYPVLRLASALATIFFVLVLAGDFITSAPRMMTGSPAPAMEEPAMEALLMETPTPLPVDAAEAATEAPPGMGEALQAPGQAPQGTQPPIGMGGGGPTPSPEVGALMAQEATSATPEMEARKVAPESTSVTQGEGPTAEALAAAPAAEAESSPNQQFLPQIQADQPGIADAYPAPDIDQEAFRQDSAGISIWRILEVSLAALALGSGLIAIYLRRAQR